MIRNSPETVPARHRLLVEWFSRCGAASVAGIGATVLGGWAFDLTALQSVVPGFATMKPNTALAFLMAGCSLLGLHAHSASLQRAGRLLAVAVLLVGGATVGEYVLNVHLGIDELLFVDADTSSPYPGRPAPATALGMAITGIALLDLNWRPPGGAIARWCAVAVLALASLALTGYVYDVNALYRVVPYTSMAIHTAAALAIVALAIIAAQPSAGLLGIAVSDTPGGTVARHLVPLIPICFSVLGLAWLGGERAGWYDSAFGLAMMTVSSAGISVAILARYASLLHRAELARRRAETDAMQLSAALADRKFEALLESAPDAMVIVNQAGRIVLLNEQAEALFGYQRQELLDQPVEILMPERFGARHAAHRTTFLSDPRRRPMGANRELWACHKDGHAFNVEVSLSPLETSEGLLISSAIRDVTARKAAEELAARLAAVVESTDDAILSKTPEGIIQTWNRAAERVFGYRADEIIGHSVFELVPDDLHGEESSLLERLRRGETVESYETVRRRKDSTTFDVALTISPVTDSHGSVIAVSTIARDVTDRKSAERRIRASLEEKETMLREIHHRVKNNLAVISSLFYLDSTYPHDPDSLRLLQEARDRVLSMAMVHETLYRSTDFARLDFGVYVKRLLGHLLRSHGARASVRARTQVDEVTMTLDTAMPCALVINELVTNCLKHAFPGNRAGEVLIAVQRNNGRCLLRVTDTGVGVPSSLDPSTARSLGLRLVRSLATQLEGEFTIRNTNPGTEATVSFPMEGGAVHVQ